MPLKIAFIFTHRIQYFTNLLDELDRRGRVKVAAFHAHETTTSRDAGFAREIAWDNREKTQYPETVLADSAARSHGPFLHSFSRKLGEALDRFEPDVVHLNGYNSVIQWQALLWAKRRGIPTLARGDGDTLAGLRRSAFAPQTVVARTFARSVDHVFHQGIENEKFWLGRGVSPARLSWIPCVSDGEIFRKNAFPEDKQRTAFREKHGVGPADVVFIISGKLEARKRPADAVEALARCGDTHARVWVLGSGPLQEELKVLAREQGVEHRITWLGFRNQTELPAVLQAADALVHPSAQDPWPYSILEGVISGLALLLSNRVGSYPDLITKAGAGEVFAVGDVGALARQMAKFTDNRTLRESYQQAARAEAARYTESAYCDRLEAVVQQLIPC